jgi:signal transduction histidine kinase
MLIILGLAVGPLLIVAILVGRHGFVSLQNESVLLQQAIADQVAQQLRNYIQTRLDELRQFGRSARLHTLDEQQQKSALSSLLLPDRRYQEITLIGPGGRERHRLSLTEVLLPADLRSRRRAPAFRLPVESGHDYFGNWRFDEALREPLAALAVPLLDAETGKVTFVLAAELRLKRAWRLVERLPVPESIEIYVVDSTGRVLVHRNPGIVLRGDLINLPEGDWGVISADGKSRSVVKTELDFSGEKLLVLAAQPVSQALRLARRSVEITFIITVLALIVGVLLVVISVRQIVRPIEALAAGARSIHSGNLSPSIEPAGRGEIFELGVALADMVDELKSAMTGLEKENADRRHAEEQLRDYAQQLEARTQELEQTRERLLRQEKLAVLGQMAGELGHELRNPLGVIANAAMILDAAVDRSDTRGRKAADMIIRRVQDISRLTDDLLSLARTRIARRERIGLRSLVDDQLTLREPPSGVSVDVNVAQKLTPIYVDAQQFAQVLDNLLTNAYQALDDGGRVTISAEKCENVVVCEITDNGPGIENAAIGKIFEPLFTTREDGIGFGLAICKNLVELNGGTIEVDSAAGRGTTFILRLPT